MNAATHLVLIPSYNTGPRLLATVQECLAQWDHVWVVVDGSTDRSAEPLDALRAANAGLKILPRERNSGKGATVLAGAEAALAAGFTHALVIDADGQHPAAQVREFMAASTQAPAALVLGVPQFGPEAPALRLHGRKLSIGLVRWEVRGRAIADPLFGFRVYPLAPLVAVMRQTRFARRYDFDPEVAVRLVWRGTPTLNLPATCRYLDRREGGISHFHYFRDNVRMVWLHTRLLTELMLGAGRTSRRNLRPRT